MTTAFEFGFFDELQKIAAKGDDDDSAASRAYRPSTGAGAVADPVKHLLYGAGGAISGELLGRAAGHLGMMAGMKPEHAARARNIAAALGTLGGVGYSLTRARKRALRRLQDQGLGRESTKKLIESGAVKPKATDVIPIFGKQMAMDEMRDKLRSMDKRVDV